MPVRQAIAEKDGIDCNFIITFIMKPTGIFQMNRNGPFRTQ
jgi:hypothetical protein